MNKKNPTKQKNKPTNTKGKNESPENNLKDTSVRDSQDHFTFSFLFIGKLPA